MAIFRLLLVLFLYIRDLNKIKFFKFFRLLIFFRWGRASYGGFNKQLERLAEKMNGAGDEDEEIGEDIDAEEVSRRLKLIRSGQFKTEDPDSDGGMNETPSKKSKLDLSGPDEDCDTLQFKRPTWGYF